MSRTNSRVSQVNRNPNRNKSNSSQPSVNRIPSAENVSQNQNKQKVVPGLRILGQDREVTEDELLALNRGNTTPTSNRSSASFCSNSSASRATPSRQVTLQAVKRKEDRDDPIEPIDWNEFNKAVSLKESERFTLPKDSDSESDEEAFPQRVLSPEEQQALVEQRAKMLTSALSSTNMDDAGSSLTQRLTEIEEERELREALDKEREAQLMKAKLKSDTEPKYRNEHYINLSARDEKNKISKSFILDKNSAVGSVNNGSVNNGDEILKVGKQTKTKGEHVIDTDMDMPLKTAVGAGNLDEKPEAFLTEVKPESEKKDEASAKDESSDDSSDEDEEEDLIGHRGKAPNQLLMEFVTCLMEKDYANAEKLCKMILIYEPDNQEALSFYPLIKEKQEQDAAEGDSAEESTDSGEEDEEGGDEDDDNTDHDDDDEDSENDDDNDDDDDDDDEDDDESSEEESDDQGPVHPDSGIASANSD